MKSRWQRLAVANGLAFLLWILTPIQTLCLEWRPANDWEYLALWVMYRPVEALTTGAVLVCLGYDLGYGLLALRHWLRRRPQPAAQAKRNRVPQ